MPHCVQTIREIIAYGKECYVSVSIHCKGYKMLSNSFNTLDNTHSNGPVLCSSYSFLKRECINAQTSRPRACRIVYSAASRQCRQHLTTEQRIKRIHSGGNKLIVPATMGGGCNGIRWQCLRIYVHLNSAYLCLRNSVRYIVGLPERRLEFVQKAFIESISKMFPSNARDSRVASHFYQQPPSPPMHSRACMGSMQTESTPDCRSNVQHHHHHHFGLIVALVFCVYVSL